MTKRFTQVHPRARRVKVSKEGSELSRVDGRFSGRAQRRQDRGCGTAFPGRHRPVKPTAASHRLRAERLERLGEASRKVTSLCCGVQNDVIPGWEKE